MTVSNTGNKVTYQGNGVTDSWPFSFPLGDPPHPEWVEVYLTDQNGAVAKLTKDYTIDTNSKAVKYPGWLSGAEPPPAQQPPKLPAGWKITLLRKVPLLQETSFRNQGTFSAVVVESAMDRLTMICQQLAEQIARCIQVPIDNEVATDGIITAILNAASLAQNSATTAQTAAGAAQTSATQAQALVAPSAALVSAVPLPTAGDAGKSLQVNAAGSAYEIKEMQQGGANNVLLLHMIGSPAMNTASTDYDVLCSGRVYAEDSRIAFKGVKAAFTERGNGNLRLVITDGTASVTVDGTNANNASLLPVILAADCTTLASGTVWTVTVYGRAVSGDYAVQRFNLQAPPVNQLADMPLIVQSPGYRSNLAALTKFDAKKFPVNYAIDTACKVRLLAKVTLDTATAAQVKAILTTTNGSDVSTTDLTLNVSASGMVEGLIDFPTVIAPTVNVDMYLATTGGFAVVEHWEARLVI